MSHIQIQANFASIDSLYSSWLSSVILLTAPPGYWRAGQAALSALLFPSFYDCVTTQQFGKTRVGIIITLIIRNLMARGYLSAN